MFSFKSHNFSFVRRYFEVVVFTPLIVSTFSWWRGLRASMNLTGYAGRNFLFLVGPPKPDKLVLQEWGFCGWVGNPPKENKILISKDAQPWISVDQMTHILCSINPPPPKNHGLYEMMWKNIIELDRLQVTVWCMCIACWITKARNTQDGAWPALRRGTAHTLPKFLGSVYCLFCVVLCIVCVCV